MCGLKMLQWTPRDVTGFLQPLRTDIRKFCSGHMPISTCIAFRACLMQEEIAIVADLHDGTNDEDGGSFDP
eukprot:m.464726 g.464726  ORF g.464726 m.464726 type:complete len:71 (+) comp21623_c0_seq1:2719-2931(+)